MKLDLFKIKLIVLFLKLKNKNKNINVKLSYVLNKCLMVCKEVLGGIVFIDI